MESVTINWRRKFALLYTGQAFSMLTSSVLQMAVIWYLTDITGSPLVVTTATLIAFLPQAVLGLFSGVFIDRYDRKRIMIISDVIIALAATMLVVAGTQGNISVFLVYLMLFIRSIGQAFHTPSLNAIIPAIVPKEHLPRCAGYAQSFQSVSHLISPALAAALYSLTSLSMVIFLDVIGAAIAVSFLLVIKIPSNAAERGEKPSSAFSELKDGFRLVQRVPGIVPLIIIGTTYAFFYSPVGSLYPVITLTYFNGTVRDSGAVEIFYALGMLLGSLVLGRLGGKLPKIRTIVLSIGGYGLCVALSGSLPMGALYVFMGLTLVMGFAVPFFNGMNTAILQMKIPNEYLGRVLSFTYSLRLFAGPVGLVFGGSVAEVIGVNYCFLISGILALALSIVAALLPALKKLA